MRIGPVFGRSGAHRNAVDGAGVVAGCLGRVCLDAPGLSCMARDETLERTNPLQTTLILKPGIVSSRVAVLLRSVEIHPVFFMCVVAIVIQPSTRGTVDSDHWYRPLAEQPEG